MVSAGAHAWFWTDGYVLSRSLASALEVSFILLGIVVAFWWCLCFSRTLLGQAWNFTAAIALHVAVLPMKKIALITADLAIVHHSIGCGAFFLYVKTVDSVENKNI